MSNSTLVFIVKRLLLFLLFFSAMLLYIYVGSGRDQMGKFYRANGNYWLADFAGSGEVVMKKNKKREQDQYDTMISLTSKKQKANALAKARREGKKEATFLPLNFPIDSWASSCLFFVFFIALILAAPASIKRKTIGLLVGLPIIYFFIYFKLWISIFLKFSIYYERFQVGFENPFMLKILQYTFNIISFPHFGLVITLLICLVIVLPKRNDKIINNNLIANLNAPST